MKFSLACPNLARVAYPGLCTRPDGETGSFIDQTVYCANYNTAVLIKQFRTINLYQATVVPECTVSSDSWHEPATFRRRGVGDWTYNDG